MKRETLKEAIEQVLTEGKRYPTNKIQGYVIFNEFAKEYGNYDGRMVTFFTRDYNLGYIETAPNFIFKDGTEKAVHGIIATELGSCIDDDYLLNAIVTDETKAIAAMKKFKFDKPADIKNIGKYLEKLGVGVDGNNQHFKRPEGKQFKFKNGKLKFDERMGDYMSSIMIYKVTRDSDAGKFIERNGIGKYIK